MSNFDASMISECPCVRCRPGPARGSFEFDLGDSAALVTSGTSQNGWPANKDPAAIDITTVAVPLSGGRKLNLQVARKAAPAMVSMIQWWDMTVEPVKSIGGYSYRDIRGYTELSNHSSGTAVDINALKHPLGAEPGADGIPTAFRKMISDKAASLGLRWGGDYRHRKDSMHVELKDGSFLGKAKEVASAAASAVVEGATNPGLGAVGIAILALGGYAVYRRTHGLPLLPRRS